MKKMMIPVLFLCTIACNKDNDTTTSANNTPVAVGDVDITSVVKAKFASEVTISVDGGNLILKSDGRPHSHKTPYWGVGHALYEPFPAGHAANPNSMIAQNYTMTISAKPGASTTHEATGLGAIGLALSGVPIFNNQEGPNTDLDVARMSSFDGSGAHPAQAGDYHYHVTGTYTTLDDANLVGFLRDGFPLYGRKDKDGTYPTNLDAYNGHVAATTEFPNGIYHYHTRNENYLNTGSYILKSGSYYGTKGTFTQ